MSDCAEKQYKYICCYSTEKKDAKGDGKIFKRIEYTDDEDFIIQKTELQEKQKIANQVYREKHPIEKKVIIKSPNKKKGDLVMETCESNSFGINELKGKELFNNTVSGLPKLELDNGSDGDGSSILILGSGKSGKSHILKEIYNKHFKEKKNQIDLLFSVNIQAKIYSDYPKDRKVNKFDRDCEVLINQLKKVNMETHNKFDYLIMLDDIIDAKYSTLLNNLILTYRNSNFSSIVSLQYPYLLSKGCRSSINQCIFGWFNTDECIESVIKSFLCSTFSRMGYHTLPAQIQLYRELTKNYHFLYYFSRKQKLVRFKLII